SELLDALIDLAQQLGLASVATGTNATDAVESFRPGIRAADERGVLAPLRDAGLSKDDVREGSRRLGLDVWDKPAAPCLASRIAYGIQVSPRRLARIERAEDSIRDAAIREGVALRDLRVRDLGSDVRVEVDADALAVLPLELVSRSLVASGFDG